MNLPLVLRTAATAGRNLHMRDELLERARKAEAAQRRFLVTAARLHHRIAMDSARSSRSLLVRGDLS